jgi:transcriptional regulator with GAF, ATPase, and Fis domain
MSLEGTCNIVNIAAQAASTTRELGFMAAQTVAIPEDHQDTRDLEVIRQSFNTHDSSGGLQRRNKLRTNHSPSELVHNCVHDSERIIGIRTAMKIVLDFIRTAKLGDLTPAFWDGAEHLEKRAALESAVEELDLLREQLYRENLALRDEVDRVSMFEEIVGTSPALQAALSLVIKVAATDSTVLITGETGTGKELVARAIHRGSDRSSRAFVSVNCAAIPRDLIASELFGHEKGAFTGATQQRLGRFELANGGTIFLDEVGELPVETQIALLRVLQEHEFERVGGTGRIRGDVRVIAATNRDLQAAISAGSFRNDLYYRLHVFPIEVPSLRERSEDIPLLVEYFIDRYARKAGKNIRRVGKKTLELLQSYPWPGNIRELQNVIERSVILCDSETFSIDESWLPLQLSAIESKPDIELPRRLEAEEKNIIEEALKASQGRVYGPEGAAAKLGIPRSTLESRIRSLKINKSRFRN